MTYEMAIEGLLQNHVVNKHRPGAGPKTVYECEHCLNWHLTSKGELHEVLNDPESLERIKREQRALDWERQLRR